MYAFKGILHILRMLSRFTKRSIMPIANPRFRTWVATHYPPLRLVPYEEWYADDDSVEDQEEDHVFAPVRIIEEESFSSNEEEIVDSSSSIAAISALALLCLLHLRTLFN